MAFRFKLEQVKNYEDAILSYPADCIFYMLSSMLIKGCNSNSF